MVKKEYQVRQANMDHKEKRAVLDRKGLAAKKVIKAKMVNAAKKESKVIKVYLEMMEVQVRQEYQDCRDCQDIRDLKVIRVLKDLKVIVEIPENQVTKVHKE